MYVNREIKIAFFGDSITEFGWLDGQGYVRQTANKLWQKGKNVTIVPAGIRGDTTFDMVERMDKDVINAKPNVMFFMGGINDIWQNRTDIGQYRENIEYILREAKKHHIKVILINLTIIGEDLDNDLNKKIETFNEFLSEFAKEKNLPLIDVHSELVKELTNSENTNEKDKIKNLLTVDGVHLNNLGNTILADKIVSEYLKRF